jgi:hypothetical protein
MPMDKTSLRIPQCLFNDDIHIAKAQHLIDAWKHLKLETVLNE